MRLGRGLYRKPTKRLSTVKKEDDIKVAEKIGLGLVFILFLPSIVLLSVLSMMIAKTMRFIEKRTSNS